MSPFSESLRDALVVFESLGQLEPKVVEAADLVLACLKSGRKLLLCGNGGSAADSSHIATEFTCRFQISLVSDGGLLTAIGNDYVFQDIFARQVQAFGKAGDVLIALSTSGKSRNVLSAIEEAKRLGVKSIVLLGKGGGFTKGAGDIELLVQGTVTARIQEAHKFLLHAICELVEPGLEKA
jgi:D-sedoheptulose 7-phosphate isomerase